MALDTHTHPQDGQSRGRLLQVLGVAFGLAVSIGNTIAGGIVRTPGEIATLLPTAGLFVVVWLVGGLYALLGANSMAELGTMTPQSGGQYVFARRALGPYAGFIVGWSDWMSTCATNAAVSIVIGEYSSALLRQWLPGAETRLVVPIAATVVLGFALLNWRGIRLGQAAQNLTALLKALIFLGIVAACFLFGQRGVEADPTAAASLVAPTGLALFVAFMLALQSVMYTYDGWTGPIYFSEEIRNPGRDIPRANVLYTEARAVIAKDAAKAESILRQALGFDLYHGAAHNDLGVLLMKQGRLYDAAGEFEWARKLLPGHPDPRLNLALVLDAGGKGEDAIAAARAALEVRPGYLPAIQAIALIQCRDNRTDPATREHLDTIIARCDDMTWTNWAKRMRLKFEDAHPLAR